MFSYELLELFHKTSLKYPIYGKYFICINYRGYIGKTLKLSNKHKLSVYGYEKEILLEDVFKDECFRKDIKENIQNISFYDTKQSEINYLEKLILGFDKNKIKLDLPEEIVEIIRDKIKLFK